MTVQRFRRLTLILVLTIFTFGVCVYLLVNQIQDLNGQLATATFVYGLTVMEQGTVQAQAAETSRILTQVPGTLTALEGHIQANKDLIESLRLAAIANEYAEQELPEYAALFAIRALQAAYSPQADQVLVTSLDQLYTRQHFVGHTAGVFGAAFSPDGQFIATASDDGTARIWDVVTGETLHILDGHTGGLFSVDYSPDGQFIVTASDDGTARIWDVVTGETLHILDGLGIRMLSAAYSPDGMSIVVGSDDNTVQIWDAATGTKLRTFLGHTGSIRMVVYSPDGQQIASASADGTARIWDTTTGRVLHILPCYADSVNHIAFSPDGQFVATGSYADDSVLVWDVFTGQVQYTLVGEGAAYSPDGRFIATIDNSSYGAGWPQGIVRIWDAATREEIRTLRGHNASILNVVYSPDGKSILTASGSVFNWDNTARIWDADPSIQQRVLKGGGGNSIATAAYSPDGRHILTRAILSRAVWIWDAETQKPIFALDTDPHDVAYSPDGTQIATISADLLQTWDAWTGNLLQTFDTHSELENLKYSPNGQRIAAIDWRNHHVGIWNTTTGELMYILPVIPDSQAGVIFSPDGKRILIGVSHMVQEWDVETGSHIRDLTGYNDFPRYSPEGRYISTISSNSHTRIWDADTGDLLHVFPERGFSFSPDDRYFATSHGDGGTVWDITNETQILRLTGHFGARERFSIALFSPDGKYLMRTSDGNNTIQIWNMVTGMLSRVLSVSKQYLIFQDFSPDSTHFITGTEDYEAHIWDTNYLDLIDYACTRVFRDFTQSERQRYDIMDDEPTCPQFSGN